MFRILTAAIIFVALASGMLVMTAQPAAAAATPDTGVITDREPDDRTGKWKRIRDWYTAGATGYWRTSSSGATATWRLNDVQGVFQFHWLLHGDGSHDGRVRWKVFEKRSSDSSYQLIKTFNPGSQENKEGWWFFPDELHLDGSVKIVAERRSGTVGVDDVRLKQVAILPKYESAAIKNCVVEHSRLMGWGQRLAQVLIELPVAYFTKGATWWKVFAAEIAAELGMDITGVDDWIKRLNIDTATHNCRKFKRDGVQFPWERGHSPWANDIAAASLTGKLCYELETPSGSRDGCVDIPIRGSRP